jgi:hypothetical protein
MAISSKERACVSGDFRRCALNTRQSCTSSLAIAQSDRERLRAPAVSEQLRIRCCLKEYRADYYNDDLIQVIEPESAARGWINTFSVVNPHLQNSYTMHYTLGFQHEITSSLALENAFVGTRGVKFLMQRWMNEPDRRTGLRPNPQLNTNYYLDESQQMSYVSWQFSLRKRFSSGLSGSVHYTWGKSLSTAGGDIGAYY